MKNNESSTDRIARAVGSGLLAITALAGPGPKTGVGKGLLGVAAILGATSAAGFCPLYKALGIQTSQDPEDK